MSPKSSIKGPYVKGITYFTPKNTHEWYSLQIDSREEQEKKTKRLLLLLLTMTRLILPRISL
jgi:hypothetical protein